MASKLYCSNCGAELPEGAVFCYKCGVRVLAQPDQPMVTRESMTAAGNIEPNLDLDLGKTDSPEDSIDMSLTTILKDLEAITAADNPSSYPNSKRYKETPFSYTDPEKPLSSLIPDTPEEKDDDDGMELEEPAVKQPIRQTMSIRKVRKEETPAAESVQDSDPWPWEIPAFTNTDENPFPAVNNSMPAPPTSKQEEPAAEEVKKVEKPAQTEEEQKDPYLNRTGVFSTDSTGTIPPEKVSRRPKDIDTTDEFSETEEEEIIKPKRLKKQAKHYKYDDDEDLDEFDDYTEPKRWPLIVLAVVILIVILFTALYFLKPSVLNKGIDVINSVSGSTLHHIGSDDDEEPASVITAEPTETPTATPEATETPEVEEEDDFIAEVVSTEDYLDEVSSHFCNFYVRYLDAMNNGTIADLENVDEDLRTELQDRYDQYNKDYTFQNNELYMDLSTYTVYSTKVENEYDVDFRVQAFNYTVKKEDNSEVENNPIINVRIHYVPDTDEWTVTQMEIDNTAEMSSSDTVQIVE